jgi:hypothetical protein
MIPARNMQLTLGIICKSVLNYDVKSEARQVGKVLTTIRNYSKRLESNWLCP